MTWIQVMLEWQRDWARRDTYDALMDIVKQHGGAYADGVEYAYTIDGEDVETGDAAKVTHGPVLPIRAREQSELILVDVPMQFEAVGIWKGQI